MSKPFVVVSNIKKHIKETEGFNTSQETIDYLNEEVEKLINKAIQRAKNDGRKTVMRRGFDVLPS